MSIKRKELVVSAIENGTVIDHIPTKCVLEVFRLLNLEASENEVLVGTNLESKKYGKKGIIKVKDLFFEPIDINKIALIAPTATLIEIKNYEVVSKNAVEIPRVVEKVVKCVNPNCITNHQALKTRFDVEILHDGSIKLWCRYCDKYTLQENMEFL